MKTNGLAFNSEGRGSEEGTESQHNLQDYKPPSQKHFDVAPSMTQCHGVELHRATDARDPVLLLRKSDDFAYENLPIRSCLALRVFQCIELLQQMVKIMSFWTALIAA